jgi:diguanylate cyclase (GGDEF)-like protein
LRALFLRTVLLGFLVALAATGTMGVAIAAVSESPRFTQLSVQDGLSQSSVQQILQDRKGLLWFGTQEGLNRFDGYRFTVHRARERDGFLHDHDITALIDDARGNLWVGTSRGLYRHDLDTGRFDTCAPPADGLEILKLVRNADGLIFFAAVGGGLWVLDPAEAQCRPRALNDATFATVTPVTGLAAGSGSAVWTAANGRLFKVEGVAAASGGRLTEVPADVGTISVLALDPKGDLWLGSVDGDLLRYRAADGHVDRFPQAPRNILSILPGRDGEIWIGARRGGLTRLDPATGEVLTYRHDPEDASSLLSDDIAAVYQDAGGSLWVGSWNGGVSRFDPNARGLTTLRHRPRVEGSLPGDDVVVMTEAADRRLWLVTRFGIVATGDPRSGGFRTAATLAARGRITAIASWDDRLLVGTARGLTVLDTPSGNEMPLGASLQPMANLPITAIRRTAGAMWTAAGTEVFRILGAATSGPVIVDRFQLPLTAPISTVSARGANGLWIGSEDGEIVSMEWSDPAGAVASKPLEISDPSARASFRSHGFVTSLHQDQNGRLWVGTRRGLGRVELASGTVSWDEDGLPSSSLAGIVPGSDGLLWIAHNRGLTRLDPSSGAMTHFGAADGAQGNGYADGAWASGPSGLLYFAGDGVTVFDPREVGVSHVKPRIVFTALEILHRVVAPRWLDPHSPLARTIDAETEITLAPDATVFSVEMAPLHYADPSGNRLRYRLDGFDREWIETDTRNRIATYTNLAPGRYVLRAQAATKNGVWSDGEATIAIVLLPPWWRTTGALVLWAALAMVVAGLIWSSARRRAKIKLALLERETLRRESLTDSLTGLHNRRFLITWLDQEVPKLLREYRAGGAGRGADLLMLLIDVDHFKSINDRYSHAVGDRVLSRVAAALKDGIRGSDLAVRWGGDEFLVVIRSLERHQAADYAERLRAAVESLVAGGGADADPGATISIGFAPFPFLPHDAEALSWQQTLELADRALAMSKRRQRNSHTGFRATPTVTVAAVLEFLANPNAATPPTGVESEAGP